MNIRLLSPALAPLLFAAATADCGYHDSNVGSTQLPSASAGAGGSGGVGPCDFAKGPGSGKAINCMSSSTFLGVDNVQCEDFLAQCEKMASSEPGLSFFCDFDGVTIFEQEADVGFCDGGSSGGSGGGGPSGLFPLCEKFPEPGLGETYSCEKGGTIASAENVGCEEWGLQCVENAKNLGLDAICYFDSVEIYRLVFSPNACDGGAGGSGGGGGASPEEICKLLPGTGLGKATDCKSGNEIFNAKLSCIDTYYKCDGIAESDPKLSVICEWEGLVLFEQEAFPGACTGETGDNGDTGSACPPNTVEVAVCEAPQSPTQICDLKCVPNDPSYQDASDNCPPPGQVVYECFGGGCDFSCYY